MRAFHRGLLVITVVAVALPIESKRASLQATQASQPSLPRITLASGLRDVPDYTQVVAEPPAPHVPDGFESMFNGKDLSGWHVSQAARHGRTPDIRVSQGMIIGTQRPLGHGGLLVTDRKFRDFELYMEVKPDWGNDSGIFFRTTESGAAYQITLDYLPGGTMGQLVSEGGIQVGPAPPAGGAPQPAPALTSAPDPGMAAWKRDEWNTIRIRVVGNAPRATVWINGQQVSDAADTENHAVGGAVEGPVAIQVHGGSARWQPGGFWRWRAIAIKDLSHR